MTGPSGTDSGSILEEARTIVIGARNQVHGDKERSFTAIALLWNSYLTARKQGRNATISALDVAHMMVLLKITRAVQGTPVRDHFVDAAGYSALAGELAAYAATGQAMQSAPAQGVSMTMQGPVPFGGIPARPVTGPKVEETPAAKAEIGPGTLANPLPPKDFIPQPPTGVPTSG